MYCREPPGFYLEDECVTSCGSFLSLCCPEAAQAWSGAPRRRFFFRCAETSAAPTCLHDSLFTSTAASGLRWERGVGRQFDRRKRAVKHRHFHLLQGTLPKLPTAPLPVDGCNIQNYLRQLSPTAPCLFILSRFHCCNNSISVSSS